jgi:hypothetical protein
MSRLGTEPGHRAAVFSPYMSAMNDAPSNRTDVAVARSYSDLWKPNRRSRLRQMAMAALIVVLLGLSVLGGLVPILQGWIFFVIALYVAATEFDSGRTLVTKIRRRWPGLSKALHNARKHRWAPKHLTEFDELTDPRRSQR